MDQNEMISMRISRDTRDLISRSVADHLSDVELTDDQIFALIIGLHSAKVGVIESLAITYRNDKDVLQRLRRVVTRIREVEESSYKQLANLF